MSEVASNPQAEPEGTPPAFGHPMLQLFAFEPSYINLNNGSYGSLPLPVSEACERISHEIEANPDRYMRTTYKPLLVTVRSRVAQLIGAETGDCVVVPNATHGLNTVLRNLDWKKDDVIVETKVNYSAISRTVQYILDTPPHPRRSIFVLEFPTTVSDILERCRAHLKEVPLQSNGKVVAIIDAIASTPGVLLSWKEMVGICKEEGVLSVIDAAHSIGQEVNINLKVAGPDFWISNLYKWFYAKRACAVLYVPKRNQHLIRTTIPTSSYYVSPADPPGGLDAPNFVGQFEWTGACDFAPHMSVKHAFEFRNWLGGEERINDYCHNLALTGGRRLAELLGTRVMDEDGEFTANMVNVGLPLKVVTSAEVTLRIRSLLESEWDISAHIYFHAGKWWVRCSAQIFNEISDFEKLGEALLSICKTIEGEHRTQENR